MSGSGLRETVSHITELLNIHLTLFTSELRDNCDRGTLVCMCVSVFLTRYVRGVSVMSAHTRLIMQHNRPTRLPSFIKTASNVNPAVQGSCVRVRVLSHVTSETPEFVCTSCQRTAESHNVTAIALQYRFIV